MDGSDDDDQEMDISDRWDDINIQADIELSGEIEIGGSYLFHKIFWMMKENLNEKERNYVWFKQNYFVNLAECVCVFYNIWGSCKFIKGVSAKRVCEWVSQVWSKKKQCWQFSRKLSSPLNWLSDYMHIRVCAHFILIFILSPQLIDFQFVCTVCSSSS